jgi:hypothetical protein
MHVDNTLRNLQLAFALRDLISDMTLEVKSNLEEELVFADEFALKVEFKVRAWGDWRAEAQPTRGPRGSLTGYWLITPCPSWLERQMNFCRGLMSAVLEELFECIRDVHREREIELEHQSQKNREVRRRAEARSLACDLEERRISCTAASVTRSTGADNSHDAGPGQATHPGGNPTMNFRFLKETFKHHFTRRPAIEETIGGAHAPMPLLL